MEIINDLKGLLINKSIEAKQLNNALTELDSRITKEAGYIDKLDRNARISALKARLVSEIDRIKHEERSSEYIFNTSKVYSGILGLAIGGIVGAIAKQNPLLSGFRLFNTELDKKESFGNVMIAVKKSGKLEDIKAVSISGFVREYKTTESNIISILRDKGYIVLTPKEFWELLHRLKKGLMEGKYRSENEQVKALLHCVNKRNNCTKR